MAKAFKPEKIKEIEETILEMPEESDERLASLLGIGESTVRMHKKRLINEGKMTREQTKEGTRIGKIEKTILEMPGKSSKIIADLLGVGERTVRRYKKRLIEEGRLTKEQIYENGPKKEIEEIILQFPAESSKTLATLLGIGRTTVKDYKRRMIAERRLTKERIDEARREKEQSISRYTEKNYGMYDDRILHLLETGFSIDEIANVLGEDIGFIKMRKIEIMLQNGLTIKDVNEAQANKSKLAECRRSKIDEMASFNKDIDVKIIEEHIEYTKANFELGRLENADVETISKAMLLDSEFITLSSVQVVVTHYTRQNKPEQATDFLGNCMDILDYDDNRREVLKKARGTIDENIKRRKQNIEMVRRMQANANARNNATPKQNKVAPQPTGGWEH